MNIHVRELFSITIKHAYYSGPCTDFDFITPAATASLMRSGKLLGRIQDGCLRVLFESQPLTTSTGRTEASAVPVCDLSGQTLTFALRLLNPNLIHFTEDPVENNSLPLLYVKGERSGELETASGIELISPIHSHKARSPLRPLELQLTDSVGNAIETVELNAGESVGQFDLRGLPEGQYRIAESQGNPAPAQFHLYLSPELRSLGVWGIVNIEITPELYATPVPFSMHLKAKREKLRYYLVTRNFSADDFGNLEVADNSTDGTKLSFEKVTPERLAAEQDAKAGILAGGTTAPKQVAVFESLDPVPRSARGGRKIQIQLKAKVDHPAEVLVESLPQSGAVRPEAHFIVHLSKS